MYFTRCTCHVDQKTLCELEFILGMANFSTFVFFKELQFCSVLGWWVIYCFPSRAFSMWPTKSKMNHLFWTRMIIRYSVAEREQRNWSSRSRNRKLHFSSLMKSITEAYPYCCCLFQREVEFTHRCNQNKTTLHCLFRNTMSPSLCFCGRGLISCCVSVALSRPAAVFRHFFLK